MNRRSLLTGLGAASAYALWMAYEELRPLRRPTQRKPPRAARNVTIGAIGSVTLRLGLYPTLLKLGSWIERRRWGPIQRLPGPGWIKTALGFIVLDYALYLWHRANHEAGFLWRFHNPHHVDLDLDVSTGSRFHFGELAFSGVVRAIELLAAGVSARAMVLYDTVAMVAVHFNHSNASLPGRLDRMVRRAAVTPVLHGIHHSIVRDETDSNFSTVFSVWDRVHGTYREDIPQSEITIGVPSYRNPAGMTLVKILAKPFGSQRGWRLPDGTVPERSTKIRTG